MESLNNPHWEALSTDTQKAFHLSANLSFIRLHNYPLVEPTYDIVGIPLANLAEIGAMKLAAIIDRGTRKDLVDLYFILQQASLEKLLNIAALKYPLVRSFSISALRGLAYFEDAEALPMPRMIDQTPWKKMKRFLEEQAMNAGRQHLEELWE